MHTDSLLLDIGAATVAATLLAYVGRWLRQPLLLSYIIAGVLIGPSGFGIVRDERAIAELSELGLAFLMFMVGLEIDLKKLATSGRVAAPVALAQVGFSGLLAFAFVRLLGFEGLPALYLGAASAFSSTMIVVKLLSDKSELDTVAGRLTLGVLIVQDVLAIIVLAVQPNLQQPALVPITLSLLAGIALAGGGLAVARFVLPPLLRWAAKSPELILISAISWCLLISYVAVQIDFSVAMGALIAGLTLSALPYTLDVVAKVRGLRDFFVTLFFVALGMQLVLGSAHVLLAAAVLSAVVIVSRFVIVGPLLLAMGYGPRVATLSSLALAQASEFSLVMVSLGLTLGHIGHDVVSIMALTLVVTATLSTYMINADHRLAAWASAWLARIRVREPSAAASDALAASHGAPVIVLGFHRVASSLLHIARRPGDAPRQPPLIIDFNPEVYQKLRQRAVPIVYGDISHPDTLEHVGIEHARVVLSTVSDDFLRGTDNLTLLRVVRGLNPGASVILCAETIEQAREMYAAGAHYVVLPRLETARAFLDVLAAIENGELDALRARALADLSERDEVMS
jgi:Kef-type K+ transport system membrane component KefB